MTLRPARVTSGAVRRFSGLGIVAVATLLASGIVNSFNLMSAPRDLIATDYGRLVLLKIGLFAAMVGIAAVNRFALTPQLGAATAVRALARNSLAEVGLGLFVFLFVGALGTMEPPVHDHVHVPTEQIPPDAAFVHIHSSPAMADVIIEPGRVGPARAEIHLLREDFTVFPAKAVTLVLTSQAASGVAAITRSPLHLENGAWRARALDLSRPGVWNISVTVDSGTGQPIVLEAPIVIETGRSGASHAK